MRIEESNYILTGISDTMLGEERETDNEEVNLLCHSQVGKFIFFFVLLERLFDPSFPLL